MDWVYLLQDKDDTSRQGRKTKKKRKRKKDDTMRGRVAIWESPQRIYDSF